jgi:hypothetical protein
MHHPSLRGDSSFGCYTGPCVLQPWEFCWCWRKTHERPRRGGRRTLGPATHLLGIENEVEVEQPKKKKTLMLWAEPGGGLVRPPHREWSPPGGPPSGPCVVVRGCVWSPDLRPTPFFGCGSRLWRSRPAGPPGSPRAACAPPGSARPRKKIQVREIWCERNFVPPGKTVTANPSREGPGGVKRGGVPLRGALCDGCL